MDYLRISYNIIKDVYSKGAYVHVALGQAGKRVTPLVTKIVYGTLENWLLLKYNLSLYYKKAPQNAVLILLLISSYCLKFLSIPEHAVVNASVDLITKIGKNEAKGFVNKILRIIATKDLVYPEKSSPVYEEVYYNLPFWIIRQVKADYKDEYEKILKPAPFGYEHIRINKNKISEYEFESKYNFYKKTDVGYFVNMSNQLQDLFRKGWLTIQSKGSIAVVDAIGDVSHKLVLDVCAAPGGKSVYLAEKGAIVTACDVHAHRVNLINGYAYRVGANINILENDGTILNPEFINKFDVVLLDVPCSGLGVINRRQDIVFTKKESDISSLNKLQRKILDTSKNYVKVGGILLYSTCTILKAENEKIISAFLKENPNFVLDKNPNLEPKDGEVQMLPINEGEEGYYIARLRKVA
ncbi:MAG TPA: transcription antitermination factor NusB [Clostridia bacterium]|jgi:16S rRNA (cytosine967-C5)-methyltransferase|nr:transcription antitermination factor NusB [Clostridia bacterium]